MHDIHDIVLLGYEHDVICKFEIDESVLEKEIKSVEIYYFDNERKTYTQDIIAYQVYQYNSQMMKLSNCVWPDFFEHLEEYIYDSESEIE